MDLARAWEIDEGPPTKYMTNTKTDQPSDNSYYLPHHDLIRDKSQTTQLRVVFDESAPSTIGVLFNDTSWAELIHDISRAVTVHDLSRTETFNDTSWAVDSSGEYKRVVNKIAHYLSTARKKYPQNKYTPLPAIFWTGTVRNFEWLSVYGTVRPIPFFRKFQITCPPRAVNVMTLRSGKKPREKTSWKGTRDRWNPTAGKENQQRRRTVHQTPYGWNTLLPTRSYHCRVLNIALYVYTTSILDYSTTLDLLNLLHLER